MNPVESKRKKENNNISKHIAYASDFGTDVHYQTHACQCQKHVLCEQFTSNNFIWNGLLWFMPKKCDRAMSKWHKDKSKQTTSSSSAGCVHRIDKIVISEVSAMCDTLMCKSFTLFIRHFVVSSVQRYDIWTWINVNTRQKIESTIIPSKILYVNGNNDSMCDA